MEIGKPKTEAMWLKTINIVAHVFHRRAFYEVIQTIIVVPTICNSEYCCSNNMQQWILLFKQYATVNIVVPTIRNSEYCFSNNMQQWILLEQFCRPRKLVFTFIVTTPHSWLNVVTGGSHDVECMTMGETEDFERKCITFDIIFSFFLLFLQTVVPVQHSSRSSNSPLSHNL